MKMLMKFKRRGCPERNLFFILNVASPSGRERVEEMRWGLDEDAGFRHTTQGLHSDRIELTGSKHDRGDDVPIIYPLFHA
jgi:hypothetical protein